ncbi:MFS transporter [Saccharomonospora xinjiangensis]|uniref:Major Facilitator Superfamily transporter n=1 Tax=Saccharomonospora xinjiangensis XJ-54 TaxID=882086 RepID=I0V8C4_9PSEU|nr:MFS transporter [Saccharomonospora xinjiangensis]EID56377.1 Major Facilitator Superfamily transporter [Saccharomonospora xinjiangensis XJ-54]
MRRTTSTFLLAAGHACVDVYQGSVAALVPFFVAERAYTYAAVSGLVLAASLLSSVVQPLFGALADRYSMPWLIPASTVLSGVGIAVSGLTGSYALTLAGIAVSGIGVAAYHPESARIARAASEGSHRAMAYFSTGGNVGFALAPFLVAVAIGTGGLRWTPVLVLPALVGAVLVLPVLRALHRKSDAPTPPRGPARQNATSSFVTLAVAMAFRSIAFVGLSAFLSLFATQRLGGTAGTIALFVLYSGGIVGSALGGSLAARWGRIVVCRWSYALSAVAIAGVVWVPGPFLYLFVALTSVGLYVPFSLQVTLGQDYLPTRVGTASGVTLGLTVSVGGLASPVIGSVADATSLHTALAPLVAMPMLSWLLLRRLREPEQPSAVVAGASRA